MEFIESTFAAFSHYAWGTPLLVLLLGGGTFFMIYSRFLPFRYFGHAIDVLRGKYDDPNDPGDISHFEALASALAATVGMGNVTGVAVAITLGGPGALFWMWMSAFVGMATKFFTCTLAIMYRGTDSAGHPQGGPMYVIEKGLGKKWKPLAIFFCVAGLLGPLPMVNANQLIKAIKDVVLFPLGAQESFGLNLTLGLIVAGIVSLVIFGGIQRIAKVASRLVPTMVVVYVAAVFYILIKNYDRVVPCLVLVVEDAFTATSVLGGAVGSIIIVGAQRAAFSNEAGIGTAPMAHGAAKTHEPVREGLVAMLGPVIDTIVVCTMTALALLVTDVWRITGIGGITLTVDAFNTAFPFEQLGGYLLLTCVMFFSFSSLFTLSYYGTKSFSYLAGAHRAHYFNYFYVLTIIVASVASLQVVIDLVDGMYAMMAIPTMISALLLAPKVRAAAQTYFGKIQKPARRQTAR